MGRALKAEFALHAKPGEPNALAREQFLRFVTQELDRAYVKHGAPLWGRHEAYAIIKEELDEMWEAIRADSTTAFMRKELVQVCAMAIRYAETDPLLIFDLTGFHPALTEDGKPPG